MTKYPTILNLEQKDINRQLYLKVLELEKQLDNANGVSDDLEDEITALKTRVKALEDAATPTSTSTEPSNP